MFIFKRSPAAPLVGIVVALAVLVTATRCSVANERPATTQLLFVSAHARDYLTGQYNSVRISSAGTLVGSST